jgi:hypothetical protein
LTKQDHTNLVNDNKEGAIAENGPDEDVAKDAGDQVGGVVDHDGTIPVNGNKSPSKRGRDDWSVNEARVGVVAEVERAQVDKVDNKEDLCPEEVGANEEHDEGEVEEVVEDEVATHAGGGVDMIGVLGEEVGDVAELEDKENDPGTGVLA